MYNEKEYQKQYRKDNKERLALNKKEWREKNKEILKEKAKIYQKENREKLTELNRLWKKNNPDKTSILYRRYNLKKKYGISLEDYENLSKSQNNQCAICYKEEKLVVDHNHTTGKVRGLLCNDCNRNLIAQREDPEIFRRAADYLEKVT